MHITALYGIYRSQYDCINFCLIIRSWADNAWMTRYSLCESLAISRHLSRDVSDTGTCCSLSWPFSFPELATLTQPMRAAVVRIQLQLSRNKNLKIPKLLFKRNWLYSAPRPHTMPQRSLGMLIVQYVCNRADVSREIQKKRVA